MSVHSAIILHYSSTVHDTFYTFFYVYDTFHSLNFLRSSWSCQPMASTVAGEVERPLMEETNTAVLLLQAQGKWEVRKRLRSFLPLLGVTF